MAEIGVGLEKEEALAKFLATQASDKMAEDVVALKVRDLSSIADFFLIMTANSVPHLKALSNHLEDEARTQFGVKPLAVDGEPASGWVLLDFGSVLVHIMDEDSRRKYELERLWSDAPRLELEAVQAK